MDVEVTLLYRVQPMDMDDQIPAVPVQAVLNPNASLETAELGCVAVVASTEIDVNTSMIPARLAPTRAKGLDGKRENHHDVRTRGTLSFLCAPDSDPSPAILLSETDGAARVAPALHLNILWIAEAIPEIRVTEKAEARVSRRARAANIRAQLVEPLTVKKESHHASSIAIASVFTEENADIGMLMKLEAAHMGTTAPTSM